MSVSFKLSIQSDDSARAEQHQTGLGPFEGPLLHEALG
jgi:hypothetical protein